MTLPRLTHARVPDNSEALEAQVPDDEREIAAFESWWRTEQMKSFPKDYDPSRLEQWGRMYKGDARKAWMARASIEQALTFDGNMMMGLAVIRALTGTQQNDLEATIDAVRALTKQALSARVSAVDWETRAEMAEQQVVCLSEERDHLKAMLRSAAPQPPAQREWVGLTDDEIRDWWCSENGLEDCDMCKLPEFAQVTRAIEAKLRERNGGAA